jgi:hypothetical protein
MKKTIVFTLLNLISISSFAEIQSTTNSDHDLEITKSPCANNTVSFSGGAMGAMTAVDALNGDVNVIKGTARNIAQCTLRGNPAVTACLTMAQSSYKNGTYVVLDIYGEPRGTWSHGTFISSTDNGASVSVDGTSVNASKSSWSNGSWHGGSEGGSRASINYESDSMVYKSYSGSPGLIPFLHKWTEKQNQNFDCKPF